MLVKCGFGWRWRCRGGGVLVKCGFGWRWRCAQTEITWPSHMNLRNMSRVSHNTWSLAKSSFIQMAMLHVCDNIGLWK